MDYETGDGLPHAAQKQGPLLASCVGSAAALPCPSPTPIKPHPNRRPPRAPRARLQVAAWYLAPPLVKLAFGSLRGYAGDASPAAALTAVESDVSARHVPAGRGPRRGTLGRRGLWEACTRGESQSSPATPPDASLSAPAPALPSSLQGNAVIVDLRSVREKEAAGSPDIPNSGACRGSVGDGSSQEGERPRAPRAAGCRRGGLPVLLARLAAPCLATRRHACCC